MIGIDTYTWRKIIRLLDTKWRDIILDLLEQLSLFITTEGRKEFEYRFPDDIYLLDKITTLPVLGTPTYQSYLKEFDATDASLLEYLDIKGYRIISEDHPMIAVVGTNSGNIVQLIDFIIELGVVYEYFSRNEMIQLLNLMRKWRNITKNKDKRYKNFLQTL